ncbi:ATP-binding protein [Ramlibacter tataouinensis]|uniref:histidine kinase n=1 Tax=Ramlibacter tataouinensis (strain ATCC BAA-407 / DSM 14655 / LMG 21543 / TTB310) TaxID=365046 RepID=F5Y5Y6_RAMTT|nr:ATP-binding protein [Ramlibacter tataouinensis]AEG91490.1 candidate histidine kinase, hybrid [Ramlibacter tataouinensis TTB310]
MQSPPVPDDEERRLRRLRRLDLLDTGPEAVLDAITELAASLTGMPIALISLVDRDRQWWKSAVGLPQGGGTPRGISFCGHAIGGEGLFEVEDARGDQRFAGNPLVAGEPHVVHYAGMPLVMPDGERIGTLCVIGDRPGRLDERGREALARLARNVVNVLLLRESEHQLGAQVRAEAALRESEARFRTVADAMPQMVWSRLPDGRDDYHNQRWYDFTGLEPAADGFEPWDEVLHPQDRAQARAAWQRCLATGQPYETELRLRHRSGDYRWVLARALPVRDDAGTVLRWMGTCTDIHDQKLAREDLQAANRQKDEFLAMLAHELRNPLAPISTAAQLLKLTARDPERVLQSSELIGRQVRHMTALVDDLLDVSRVTRGLAQIERKPVDLKQVVHSALEQARPHIESHRHQVTVHLPPGPAQVTGDRVRLVQVVSNLLNNAAKYTPEGGAITVALALEGGAASIRVSDNGTGIDAALLPHVFDLFTQAKRTPDRSQGGLGLGLALVRSLVELHGGSVLARSEGRGCGSSFTVTLPLSPEAAGAPAPAEKAAPVTARSLSILVVDDNVDAAVSLGIWLEMEGHRVVVKTGAAQALAAASRQPAEVYVLDIGLPVMDGYELARQLRALPAPRRATFIALTGYGQAHDIAQSRAAGFDHHFVKPVDPAELTALLTRLSRQAPGPEDTG